MADGIVYLSFDFTVFASTQTTARIERGPTASGPWTFLNDVPLLSEAGSYYDTTAPINQGIWYRVTGTPGTFIPVYILGPFFENVDDRTVLLKDPLRPWANLTLDLCTSMTQALGLTCDSGLANGIWVGLDDKVYRSDANMFDVYNARVPADIYGVRKRLDSGMRILTKTIGAKDATETFFAAGGPVQIQTPAVYLFPDAIVQPGDVTEEYLTQDQRRPIRMWSVPFTVVDAPIGPAQGTECANWCAVADAYPTFATLTASGYTWGNVASGTAVCPSGGLDGFGIGPFGDGPFGDGG